MAGVRPATEDDLPALAGIFSESAGYLTQRYRPDQADRLPFEADDRLPMYRHLLQTGTVIVAEEDEGPVGFAAAIVRDGVWFLSQLWVLPRHHAGGIGSALLDEALAAGTGCRAFTVVASPHPAALTLYMRASMYPMFTQLDMFGGGAPPRPPEGIRALTPEDGPWIDALDREVRGAARPEDHAVFTAWGGSGHVLERDGTALGYVYAFPDGKVGPGAAHRPEDVPLLLSAARSIVGGPITIAVPGTNWTALRELVRAGLAPAGSNTFMSSVPIGDGARYLSSGGGLG
jgi:GNAT superfamily N-acetyltransferase